MNIKLKQVLTFALLFVFAISIPVSIYILKNGNLDLRISAFDSEEPVKVMVSDRTSSSVKILWITEKKVFGAIKINEINDLISENFETNSHFLQINNLKTDTNYSFSIYSGTKEFPQKITFKTLSFHESNPVNYIIYGQVFDKTGIKVQQKGLITIEFRNSNSKSELLGTTINETGGFQFNLKNLVETNTGRNFQYNQKLDATITIFPSGDEQPIVKIFTFDFSKQNQIPNIYLGDINLDIIPGVGE